MTASLDDPVGAATCPWLPALQTRTLVGVAGRNVHVVAVEAVVGLGVGDSRAQHFVDLARHVAGREGKHRSRLGHGATADRVQHEPGLARRAANPLRLSPHFGGLGCLRLCHFSCLSAS